MATDENRRQYEDEGYFVLDEGVTAAELAQLRAICDRYITEYDTSAAVPEPEGAAGGDPEMQLRIMPDGRTFRTNIVNRKGYRYHLAGHYFDDPGAARVDARPEDGRDLHGHAGAGGFRVLRPVHGQGTGGRGHRA